MARILIIDDDDGLRQVVRWAVEADGHDVEDAGDGRAGVEAFRGGAFDLVITDVFMPNQDGIETIAEIRVIDAEVPILAISAGVQFITSSDILADALELGASEILTKPFKVAALREAVAGLLGVPAPS